MSYTRHFTPLTLIALLAMTGAAGLGAQVDEQVRTGPPVDDIVERIVAVVAERGIRHIGTVEMERPLTRRAGHGALFRALPAEDA